MELATALRGPRGKPAPGGLSFLRGTASVDFATPRLKPPASAANSHLTTPGPGNGLRDSNSTLGVSIRRRARSIARHSSPKYRLTCSL